jgi:hypothetical protein
MNRPGWLLFLLLSGILLFGCKDEETTDSFPFILFDQGNEFVSEGDSIPVGAQMHFGIEAVGGGYTITDLRVKRITADKTITELDKGIYIDRGGLDTTLIFTKSDAAEETWTFFIQNSNRDTASVSMTVYLGSGSAYGPISYYPSITVSYSGSEQYPHFLDLSSGEAYGSVDVAGHEQDIDLAAFWYITSGRSSPTLTCPGYPSAQTYYPQFASWSVKNSTLYDYKTVDNDLISIEEFDAAQNDSLLVNGYLPQNVSGLCKYCYAGKVVPFKTANGKYGMIKVIRADEQADGSMEIAVKIQK